MSVWRTNIVKLRRRHLPGPQVVAGLVAASMVTGLAMSTSAHAMSTARAMDAAGAASGQEDAAGDAAGDTPDADPADRAPVEAHVRDGMADGGTTTFWVYLRDEADLAQASSFTDRGEQGRFVYDQLTNAAESSQADLIKLLDTKRADYQEFWIANTVQVTGDEELLRQITSLPGVERVTADRTYAAPEPTPAEAEQAVEGVEWNIDRINAPQVWNDFGATGDGIVVGTIDSGVQFDHPALVTQYRGNQRDGAFDHNYHWHDPSQVCGSPSLAPCDDTGHGTHVTGTIVGDDGTNRIGVAPGAQWIAAKGCENRSCSQAALLSSAQFMLAPTDLEGNNPDPQRRPHIVNNSWGASASNDPWFQPMVDAWLAAGIFPQFANGNTSGGAVAECGSAGNPANLPGSYSAGAFDIDNEIANFSNRGPSAFNDDLIKPNIAAPGANIRSSVPGDAYDTSNGTSMASPHVAGAVALLWSAAGPLVRDIDATRELLDATAVDVEDLTCGGEPGDNNVWGEGRMDVYAAMKEAPRGPAGQLMGTVTDAAGKALDGAVVTIRGTEDRERIIGEDGSYSIGLLAGEYSVTASAFGYEPQTVEITVADDEQITESFTLTAIDTVTLSGQVTDGSGHGWPMYAKVEVPDAPVSTFTDPMTGHYQLTLPAGNSYQLRVESQYPGYAETIETAEIGDSDATLDLTSTVAACDRAPGYRGEGEDCQPVEGGLVLGQVRDLNTADGIIGATVASESDPDDSGTSIESPDPENEDGFYWLFSSQTGRQQVTASAANYQAASEPVEVVADAINEADFDLAAGELSVDPADLSADLRLGESADRTFTITNGGTAPADVELQDLPGSFTILGGPEQPAAGAETWNAPSDLVRNPEYDPDSPTSEGQYLEDTLPEPTPSAAGDIITSWLPETVELGWGVGFDGEVWLSDVFGGVNQEFAVDGAPTDARFPTPWADEWPADMAKHGDGEMCQVGVGNNGIYCWDTDSGELNRSITGSFPWTAASQRGLAYRADDDTFYIGGWNEDILYQVAGFSHESPGEVLNQCSFAGMGISGLAWNPTAQLLWIATNSATDDIYLVDPEGCGVLDSLGHPTPGFNGAGLHMNEEGNLWLVSQAESGAENRAYLMNSGVPNVSDVPWLAATPAEMTLEPGDSVDVTVTMDSDAADQAQPGMYAASLVIDHDTPYPVDRVGVTMEAAPPRGWGQITGTVTGIDCGDEQRGLAGAEVHVDGRKQSWTLRADANGRYTHWLHANNNPVRVRSTDSGYQSESQRVRVRPARETVADFSPGRTDEFGYTCSPEEGYFAQADTVLPISGTNATETIDLPFPFTYYGEAYTEARICSNGYVELLGPANSLPIGCSFPNARIPAMARPDAAIYSYWDPNLLIDDHASIRADSRGEAPDRQFVIEYRNVGYADLDDPAQRIDFNIVLHENGDVVTQYRNIGDDGREQGNAATIGIEDHAGATALQYSFNEPVLSSESDVTSIRYQPPPSSPPEPSEESWVARYSGPGAGDDVASDVGVSPDGSQVFVTGHGAGDGTGDDFATVAYDTDSGEELWSVRYDGPASGDDIAQELAVSPDGSRVFVSGYGPGDGTGDDYATIAYDADSGDELWVARHDGAESGGDQTYAMAMSPNGAQVFVTGRSIGDGTSFDYATVAYDATDGTESWVAIHDGPQPSWGLDQAFAVDVSPDGGQVFVTGQSRGDGTGYDYGTVAYDATDGTQLWVADYDGPGSGNDIAHDVDVSPDGSQVFVTGYSSGEGTGDDYATVSYDATSGAELWVSRYDGPASRNDRAQALSVSPDGEQVFVTGQSRGDESGDDYGTLAYDVTTGDELWISRYDGPAGGADSAAALGVSPDGARVYVTGESQAGDGTGDDYATTAYNATDGSELWGVRYNGPGIGSAAAHSLDVSSDGAHLYVTGGSPTAGTSPDYATVAYDTTRMDELGRDVEQ